MNIIKENTIVTYPSSSIEENSEILLVQNYGVENELLAVITEKTPFHPVDNSWPDQPADKGSLILEGTEFPVVNVIIGIFKQESNMILFGETAKMGKGPSASTFVVAHIINKPSLYSSPDAMMAKDVVLKVDRYVRKRLSASHTGCHLMALALNKVTRSYWRKDVIRDSLENPDLDRLALQKSSMSEEKSIDHYRFGKSLHKKGFDTTKFLSSVGNIEDEINKEVENWRKSGSDIKITANNVFVNSIRYWSCKLDGKEARIPCGGTHLTSLREISDVRVNFELNVTGEEITTYTTTTLREG